MKKVFFCLLILISFFSKLSGALDESFILIPMDESQANHLKAYGIVYNSLEKGYTGEWFLNYRGGSFLLPSNEYIKSKSALGNVSFIEIDKSEKLNIYNEIEKNNMERVELNKSPKIAVYTPPESLPWDDAVTLVLKYAEIPYKIIYDKEILSGDLKEIDWLHLHHEDFTGQYGKFYSMYRNEDWYIKQKENAERGAKEEGFSSVQKYKTEVAKTIQKFVNSGGFLFAMCSATETIDVALAFQGIDIVESEIDGTPIDPNYKQKVNFNNTFAFQNFEIFTNPYIYKFSTIDIDLIEEPIAETDSFQIYDFSAKLDPIPTMLIQNHSKVILEFLGQTTEFHTKTIKPYVTILAGNPNSGREKYIYGNYGKGFFTFYGGHDPEDFQHFVGDPPTNLALYPNSPGYRLILNNVIFPAAKKRKQKT